MNVWRLLGWRGSTSIHLWIGRNVLWWKKNITVLNDTVSFLKGSHLPQELGSVDHLSLLDWKKMKRDMLNEEFIQRTQVFSSYRNIQMMGSISNWLWSEKQSLRNITQCIFPLHCLYSFLFIDTSISRKKNEHRSHGFTVIFPQLSFHPRPFCSPPAHHQKQTVPVIKCTRTFTNTNNWTMVRKDVTFLVGFSIYFKLSGFFLDLTKNPIGGRK